MNNNGNWYALFVKTGSEDRIKMNANHMFKGKYAAVVPKRRMREKKRGHWVERLRVLFPGYVLLKGEITPLDYSRFKKLPGVIRLLREGCRPARIHEEEIYVINRLMQNGEIIDTSNLLADNGKVFVKDGPLTGLEGLITHVNKRKGRAKVQISFMGGPRVLHLPVKVLVPRQ